MRKILVYLMITFNIFSLQSSWLIIDNDAAMSDKWYTNGIELKLDNYFFNEGFNVRESYIIGEKIYTPTKFYKKSEFINEYDRPFAGLLYFGILKEKYFPEGNYKKEGFLVEMTGNSSLSGFVQKTYHKMLFFRPPNGWDTQIEDIYGIAYVREESPIYLKWDFTKNLSLSFRPIAEIHLGNVMMYARNSAILNLGHLENIYEFGEKIANRKTLWNMDEYYLTIETGLTLKGHDSTLEGDIFKNQSPLTFDIYPLVLQSKAGVFMRWDDFSVEYDLTMLSTEIKNMEWVEYWHKYHSLKFNFYY